MWFQKGCSLLTPHWHYRLVGTTGHRLTVVTSRLIIDNPSPAVKLQVTTFQQHLSQLLPRPLRLGVMSDRQLRIRLEPVQEAAPGVVDAHVRLAAIDRFCGFALRLYGLEREHLFAELARRLADVVGRRPGHGRERGGSAVSRSGGLPTLHGRGARPRTLDAR